MTNQHIQKEFDAIIQALQEFPDGASAEEIKRALDLPEKHHRTFQRRLSDLVKQNRFIEVIEIEIMSLHEGNIARFKIRPAEYMAWRSYWS